MPIPTPEPGLVINYAYRWHYEHHAGKAYPSASGPTKYGDKRRFGW